MDGSKNNKDIECFEGSTLSSSNEYWSEGKKFSSTTIGIFFIGVDFSKLLDIRRIFQAAPGASFEFSGEFWIFFGLLFLTGVALRIAVNFKKNRVSKKLLRKIKNLALTVSILGFLYLFFRSENIYLFSGRYILAAILLVFIIWAGFIGFYAIFKMPKELEEYKKKEMIKKYLPKKKNK